MAVTSETLRKLTALNLSPEQMSGVLNLLADDLEKEEERKRKQNERKRRERDSHRTVTGQSQDSGVTVTNEVAHIENARAPDSLILDLKKVSKNTASRFQLDAIPEDWIAYCRKKHPDLDPFETFDAFRDWWIAVPGSKGLKLDWFATWRTWLRNQKTRGHGNAKSPQTSSSIPRKSNVTTLIPQQR